METTEKINLLKKVTHVLRNHGAFVLNDLTKTFYHVGALRKSPYIETNLKGHLLPEPISIMQRSGAQVAKYR